MTGRLDTHGWEAHLVWDLSTLPLDAQRIYLRQRAGDSYNVVASLTADRVDVVRVDPDTLGTVDALPSGILIPRGAAEAIAQVVQPGPTAETLAALREALEVERRRVYRMPPQVGS